MNGNLTPINFSIFGFKILTDELPLHWIIERIDNDGGRKVAEGPIPTTAQKEEEKRTGEKNMESRYDDRYKC